MSLYQCRSEDGGLRVVKFSDDLEVESVYHLRRNRGRFSCECFAANRPSCRHREMIKVFIETSGIDTGRFYDWDHGKWRPSLRRLLWPQRKR